jgi:hypothetical protein
MAFYAHTPPKGSDDFHSLQEHLSKQKNQENKLLRGFGCGMGIMIL